MTRYAVGQIKAAMKDGMSDFYILKGKEAVRVEGVLEWARMFGTMDRHVAQDEIGGVRVSTVFLGLDHAHFGGPPLIFETMVFGGVLDGEQERYSTWEEAEAGHAAMLARVRAAPTPSANLDDVSTLVGRTLTEVRQIDNDSIIFECTDGARFSMYHSPDCCESVVIEDVSGDLADLIGTPILVAEERTSEETPPDVTLEYEPESQTWTFYTLRTIKGTVDIRWHGASNGYYSESVSFRCTSPKATAL